MFENLTQVTTNEELEALGITDLVFSSNSLNWKGWKSVDGFNSSNTYVCNDSNSGLFMFINNSSLNIRNVTQANLYVLFHDASTHTLFESYNNYDNFLSAVSDNISTYISATDYNWGVQNGSPGKSIPGVNLREGMLKLKGADKYLYAPLTTCDGVKSQKLAHLYGYSAGTTSTDIWNTDIVMENGDILTPIYSYNAYNSSTNTYTWICALKKA
jgi:hypothetical protein